MALNLVGDDDADLDRSEVINTSTWNGMNYNKKYGSLRIQASLGNECVSPVHIFL